MVFKIESKKFLCSGGGIPERKKITGLSRGPIRLFLYFETVGFFSWSLSPFVETLHSTQGNLLFGPEIVENQAPLRAQHPGDLLHRMDP
jgi:hypothetical protein